MKRCALCLLLGALLLTALPVFAQEQEGDEFSIGFEAQITLPEGFTARMVNGSDLNDALLFERVAVVTSRNYTVEFAPPDEVALLALIAEDSPLSLLELLVTSLGGTFDESEIIEYDDAVYPIIGQRFHVSDGYREAYIVVFDDGSFGAVSVDSRSASDVAIQRRLLDGLIRSFVPNDDPLDDLREQLNEQTATETEGDCTVSTDTASAARLRVGPGENRSSVAFLPVDVEVSVTGRLVLDDGSVWYQLDKTQAAPQSAANEIWVSAEQVEATGACDTVGETAAPPINPIIAPPAAGGGDTDAGSPQPPPESGTITPQGGTWTMTLNQTINVSCQGLGNIPIPANEIFSQMTFTFSAQILNADAMVYGGDRFDRVAGTNTFFGIFDFGGNIVQMRFFVQSPTRMTGEGIIDENVDGVSCNGTFTFLTTR